MYIRSADATAAFALTYGNMSGRPKAREETKYLFVHKHGVNVPKWPHRLMSMIDLAAFHAYHPELTNVTGRLPYHLSVWQDSAIEQGLSLLVEAPHALALSASSISVAVMYDNDTAIGPGSTQYEALKLVCREIKEYFPIIEVVGHDEKPEASNIANKQCPTPIIDMNLLREQLCQTTGK